jgi:thiamine-monophosphate kinase
VVAVTGEFGKTSAGLRILFGNKKPWPQRFSKLVYSVLHPVARLQTGLKIARSGLVSSSIDSSDGLAWSLHEIARLSDVNIVLEEIPVAQEVKVFAKENSLVSEELALFGGEEYELVLTIKKDRFVSLRRKIPSLRRIGNVESGPGDVIARFGGKPRKVEPRGYEHFT